MHTMSTDISLRDEFDPMEGPIPHVGVRLRHPCGTRSSLLNFPLRIDQHVSGAGLIEIIAFVDRQALALGFAGAIKKNGQVEPLG